MCNGTKAYKYKKGEKSANARKVSVRGGGWSFDDLVDNVRASNENRSMKGFLGYKGGGRDYDDDDDEAEMEGGGNGVEVNVKYAKLPKALQPTEEDLHPTPKTRGGQRVGLAYRRPRLPKESYEGFHDEENDVYTHSGRVYQDSPLVHSEMLQDKALGLLKGLPRRLGVEDPKYKRPTM
jgi:hypothetical protein